MRFVFPALFSLLTAASAHAQAQLETPDLLSGANIRRELDEPSQMVQAQPPAPAPAPAVEQAPVIQPPAKPTKQSKKNSKNVPQAPAVTGAEPTQQQPATGQQPAAQGQTGQQSAAPQQAAKPAAPPPPPPPPAELPAYTGPMKNSEVRLTEFTWGADGRYKILLTLDGKGLQYRGDLRANSKTEFVKDRVKIGIRHYPQDFLILAVSVDSDDFAHVFLIEASGSAKDNPFRILNSSSIRARRVAVIEDMEEIMSAFKKVAGFDTALAMRKTADYFSQKKNVKAHDLMAALEREEPELKVLAKPKTNGTNDQGIVSPELPSKVAQTPAPTRDPNDPMDIRPGGAIPSPDDDYRDPQQQAWLRAQRQRQRNQGQIVGYDAYGRPIFQGQQQQYGQGQMQYDPNTGGYYRRQYQTPGYPQQQYPGQQQPGYYRQNPFF